MKRLFIDRIATISAALVIVLAVPILSHAQRRGGGGGAPSIPVPQDQTDYTAWVNTKDPAKKIQLGEKFIDNYPSSQFCGPIFDQLVIAYYMQQDWNHFFATSDKALAKFPDDVSILTLTGWVIPHQYNPDDPDAAMKLAKAEMDEKHAIDVIDKMVKPASVTDDQFAAYKAQGLAQAYSGLGLVYFRRQDYDNAVKQLQLATQTAGSPDPTDIYALGVSLDRLSRYGEAADAFQKCAAIAGPLQDRCKQSADQDKTQAAAQPK